MSCESTWTESGESGKRWPIEGQPPDLDFVEGTSAAEHELFRKLLQSATRALGHFRRRPRIRLALIPATNKSTNYLTALSKHLLTALSKSRGHLGLPLSYLSFEVDQPRTLDYLPVTVYAPMIHYHHPTMHLHLCHWCLQVPATSCSSLHTPARTGAARFN